MIVTFAYSADFRCVKKFLDSVFGVDRTFGSGGHGRYMFAEYFTNTSIVGNSFLRAFVSWLDFSEGNFSDFQRNRYKYSLSISFRQIYDSYVF